MSHFLKVSSGITNLGGISCHTTINAGLSLNFAASCFYEPELSSGLQGLFSTSTPPLFRSDPTLFASLSLFPSLSFSCLCFFCLVSVVIAVSPCLPALQHFEIILLELFKCQNVSFWEEPHCFIHDETDFLGNSPLYNEIAVRQKFLLGPAKFSLDFGSVGDQSVNTPVCKLQAAS